jgi:hypothetical protein
LTNITSFTHLHELLLDDLVLSRIMVTCIPCQTAYLM